MKSIWADEPRPASRKRALVLPDLNAMAAAASPKATFQEITNQQELVDFWNKKNLTDIAQGLHPYNDVRRKGLSDRSELPIYTFDTIHDLLNSLQPPNQEASFFDEEVGHFKDTYKIRYSVFNAEDGLKFVFGEEGAPQKHNKIPAHRDLTDVRPLIAGNMFFKKNKEDNSFELVGFNNKSGDFKPSEDRLIWVLKLIAKILSSKQNSFSKKTFTLGEWLTVSNLNESSVAKIKSNLLKESVAQDALIKGFSSHSHNHSSLFEPRKVGSFKRTCLNLDGVAP